MNLTEGAIPIMLNPENKEAGFKPVLQVTDLKFSRSDRFLLRLSDGAHTYCGVLVTELDDSARSQGLQKGSVVKVSLFNYGVILKHKLRIIIVIDFDLLLEKCNLIGNPKPLVLKDKGSSSIDAKGAKLPSPNSGFSANDIFMVEHAKREASLWQHAYKVEKKAREAAELELIKEQEANKKLREDLESIRTHGPTSHRASPFTFTETSPVGVLAACENSVEFEVVNSFPNPLAAEQELIDEQEANKRLSEELECIKTNGPASHHASPLTLIETSSIEAFTASENFEESEVASRFQNYLVQELPMKKRSKCIRKSSLEMNQKKEFEAVKKCQECETTKSPQWRVGPLGSKTLCNACGLRYRPGPKSQHASPLESSPIVAFTASEVGNKFSNPCSRGA